MDKIDLNGIWKLYRTDGELFGEDIKYLESCVPGSVYQTLLKQGVMKDPYYRDNELDALKIVEQDFTFRRSFFVDDCMLKEEKVLLRFDGVDTLCDVYVNEQKIGFCNNMHCYWEFDVTSVLREGENDLKVMIHSPTKYIKEENEKVYTGGVSESMEGFGHLRKAHCMFGWDWGPRLPDEGIFRSVSLLVFSEGRFQDIYIRQEHENGTVKLKFRVNCEWISDKMDGAVTIFVTSPTGVTYQTTPDKPVLIEEPEIWWPNGYGKQPLYQVEAVLTGTNQKLLDTWNKRIGLRTLTVNQEEDQWGNCFAHEVNGIKIFAMGADYIPEDNILGRLSKERTERLLRDCVSSHYNSIRVWGGGFYPDDYFFDLCDELGLLVWQDFMYACASYELTDEFEENIRRETVQIVQRIRSHPCLALWCGNNEMESQTMDKVWKPSRKQEFDYIKIFEYILPEILKKEDPDTFYWPSSPSSGGNYDNPWDENRGDTHYWDVWHGEKPITEFRKYYFRYLSEFGFQSFPSIKTIESFTEKKDRNIFSRVMEMHQRNGGANGKILAYLSQTYLYPKNFEYLVYASQLLQAEAVRYGIEHNRRHRGRCMGTVVWQLNDIWPAASWSGIDYFGRWKALQYAEKKAFAPILLSCEEMGEMQQRPFCVMEPKEMEQSVRFHVANETFRQMEGIVRWSIRTPDSQIVRQGEEMVVVPPLSGTWLAKIDLSEYDVRRHYISYGLFAGKNIMTHGTCILTMPKHFEFINPELSVRMEGKNIIIRSESYAKNVEIEGVDGDILLSDNYFDMDKGEKIVQIVRGNANNISVKSVFDIGG